MDTISSFRTLHAGDRILLLPNVWDAASAALVASVGASAIATTSAGLAWACGFPDGNALPPARLLDAVADICRVAGTLPVTVDIEEGYSDDAERVARLVGALRALGVAGINIEDGAGDPTALERKIAAIKATCDVFVNARTDVWFRDLAEGEAAVREACSRGRRYALAGADGFFVPGIENGEDISAVAREVGLPLNVLSTPGLLPPAELFARGVRRLSAGIALSKMALGTTRLAAQAFLSGDRDADVFARESVSYGEMNALMQTAIPDFRGGKRFPRRGRLPLGRFLWLARVFDKAARQPPIRLPTTSIHVRSIEQ